MDRARRVRPGGGDRGTSVAGEGGGGGGGKGSKGSGEGGDEGGDEGGGGEGGGEGGSTILVCAYVQREDGLSPAQ